MKQKTSGRGHNSTRKTKGKVDEIDVHVGSRLKVRRSLLGLSQEKLAKTIGLTFQQIQKYERGLNRISAGRLYIFALILEVPVAYFYEGLPEGAIKDLSFSEENKWVGTKEEDIFLQKDVLQFAQNYALLKATDPRSTKLLKQFLQSLVDEIGGDQ